METITIQMDSDLFRHFCDVCGKMGADPQDVAERFCRWCAGHPKELQKWLQGAQLELRIPYIPLTDPQTQLQTVTDFRCAWGAPVQIKIEDKETVLLPFSYYLDHFCTQEESDDLRRQVKETIPSYPSVTLTDPEHQLRALTLFCLELGSPVRVTYDGKTAFFNPA